MRKIRLLITIVGAVIGFAIPLFMFWVSGHEFVRGGSLAGYLIFSFMFSAVVLAYSITFHND